MTTHARTMDVFFCPWRIPLGGGEHPSLGGGGRGGGEARGGSIGGRSDVCFFEIELLGTGGACQCI